MKTHLNLDAEAEARKNRTPWENPWKKKARLSIGSKVLGSVALGVALTTAVLATGTDIAASYYETSSADAEHLNMSVQDLRNAMTIPHFVKITGITETLVEQGVTIPENVDLQLRYAARMSQFSYAHNRDHEGVLTSYDMAHSEGVLETRAGEWNVANLDEYVKSVIALDRRFVQVVRSATDHLQEQGMSTEEADAYVHQSVALSYLDYLQPGKAVVEGLDPRMQHSSEDHQATVSDMHAKLHAFFQERLESLDIADRFFAVDLSSVLPEPDVEDAREDAGFDL